MYTCIYPFPLVYQNECHMVQTNRYSSSYIAGITKQLNTISTGMALISHILLVDYQHMH